MQLGRQTGDLAVVIRLVGAQFVALLVVGFLSLTKRFVLHQNDLHLYYESSLRLFQGQIPYRDFPFEYPPLALLPMVLPQLITLGQPLSFQSYMGLFLLENAILSTLVALILLQFLRYSQLSYRPRWVLSIYLLFIIINAPLLPWRYDLFPALLTLLALLCVVVDRPTLAGLWLGCGITAKIYPIVLIPIFSAYYLAGRKYHELLRLLLATIGTTCLIILPFWLLAPGKILSFVQYHKLRGLQIETVPAGIISLAHIFRLTQVKQVYNYGANHLVSPLADSILKLQPFVFLTTFLIVIVCCLSRFQYERANTSVIAIESLVTYIFIALLTFTITNKVFSTQYMIWLLPFAPLLPRPQAAWMTAIFTLTTLLFPLYFYDSLVDLHPAGVLLLNLRNLLVVALLLWLLLGRLPAWIRVPLKSI